jgi:hypothetical protein
MQPALRPLTRWARRALPCLALALVFSLPAHAQWKWRDPSGRINISDRPPPNDVPEKDILARPQAQARRSVAPPVAASAASSAASAAPTALEREVQARKRQAEQEEAAKNKAEEERIATIKAQNCRNARNQIAALESGQRIARINDKGEREVLDDKGRAEEMRRAREVANSDCR